MSSDLLNEEIDESGPKTPSRRILQHEVSEGLEALDRPFVGLCLSGLSAGLDVGFSLFLMAVVRTLLAGVWPEPVVHLLVANMYAVGFLFVVLGRSELFTEQTTLAVLPVLSRHASPLKLLRLWLVVYATNMIGAAAFAFLAVLVGARLGVIELQVFGEIARPVVAPPGLTIFLSAVFAGWLMGLLSWLVAAGRDTISQLAIVWLIGTVIGLSRLHHVVVGTVEVLAGVFAEQGVTLGDYGHFLLWATLGNVMGGSVFVALIKYNVAVQGKQQDS